MLLALLLAPATARAQTISLSWDPSSSSDVIGYIVEVGINPGSYTQTFDVGASRTFAFTQAVPGTRYYFAVRAYDAQNNRSGSSNEVSWKINVGPTLTPPGNQSSLVGTAVSLDLSASDDGDPLTFTASGLPTGLTINASTGRITGSIATAGSRTVTVSVSDGPLSASRSFVWTATAPPADALVVDRFEAAAGALLTTHLPDLNLTSGRWTISGATPAPRLNAGRVGISVGPGHLQATLNTGVSDFVMAVDCHVGTGPYLPGLAFRLTDGDNHLLLLAYDDTLHLYRRQRGAFTLLAIESLPPILPGSTHRLEARASGSTIEGWWDGVRILQAVDSFQSTATRHGLDWNSAYDSTTTFDDFEIRRAGATAPGTPGSPSPSDAATAVSTSPTLRWVSAGATSYDVRFGTTNPPATAQSNTTASTYTPAALEPGTTYYWQVVARNATGTTTGPVWRFATSAATGEVVISDTFTGANGTTLATHAPDVNLTATAWRITGATPAPRLGNGRAAVATGTGHLQATVNAGTADVVVAVDCHMGTGAYLPGLVVRHLDADNHLLLLAYDSTLHLYRRQLRAYTLLAIEALPAILPGTTHRLEARTNGHTVEGWWDGVRILQAVTSFQSTVPRHGIDWNSAYDAATTYDNFEIRRAAATVPGTPGSPTPAASAVGVSRTPSLTWVSSGATSYDVRFGTSNPPAPVASGLTSASYTPPALLQGTSYYWQVVANNGTGSTIGPVWSFTTTATLGEVLVSDSFNGTAGTLLTTHAPDVNRTATAWRISGSIPAPRLGSGTAVIGAGLGHVQATVNAATPDVVVAVDCRIVAGAYLPGLVIRHIDAANHLLLLAYDRTLHLYRNQQGTYTLLAIQPIPAITPGSTHRLEARAVGTTIEGWWDGVRILQVTEPFGGTATRHGIDWNSGYDPLTTYDNFELRRP